MKIKFHKICLIFFTLISCSEENLSEPIINNGNIRLNLDLIREFNFQQDNSSSKSLQFEDSDFVHVYDSEITINFTSEPPGYSESLTFNPNNNTQRVTLPYGEYNWEISPENNPSPISNTLSVFGQSTSTIIINEPSVNLSLNVDTDYALVTVNDDYTSNVTLTHEDLNLSMNIKDGYNYGYVMSGTTSSSISVIDINSDSYTANLGLVESCKHYKYQLDYSDVGVNSLICICEPFEVEERYLIPDDSNVVTDHEGNSYEFVEICGKLWTTSYLKTTTYKNGNPINNPLYTSSLGERCITAGNCSCELSSPFTDIINNQIPTYVYPSSFGGHFQMINYKDDWGLQYNKWIISRQNDIIPDGWRIPTNDDFIELFDCLGATELRNTSTRKWNNLDQLRSNVVADRDNYNNIAGVCNSYYTGPVGWFEGSQGTNSSGMSLIPSGISNYNNFGSIINTQSAVLMSSDLKAFYFPGNNQYYDVDMNPLNDGNFVSVIMVKNIE